MDRATPVAHSEEIELYIRTYYSLLRSSAPIRIRSLEETHAAMNSSLHQQAESADVDVSALVYCALRLPSCIPETRLMVMGQMEDVFRRAGYEVEMWQPVRARARRRKFYYNAEERVLAAYVASVSDIDDLIPSVTTFQIEWNKIHEKLNGGDLPQRLAALAGRDASAPGAALAGRDAGAPGVALAGRDAGAPGVALAGRDAGAPGVALAGRDAGAPDAELMEEVRRAIGLSAVDFGRLWQIWPGRMMANNLALAAAARLDMQVTVLGSGLSDYRRSVQQWWGKIEQYCEHLNLAARPIYLVSSNVHSLVNLVSGLARDVKDDLLDFVRERNPEGLWAEYEMLAQNGGGGLANFLYYAFRLFPGQMGDGVAAPAGEHRRNVAERERAAGITRISDAHCLDVEAQVFELRSMRREWLDHRVDIFSSEEWELLARSDALIFNIDYPLGMAAYHVFSQISTAIDRLQGVYILGKAATLNGRVGDVMIPNVVYDEHSSNSYLFRNCFSAQDVAPFLAFGTVFDNQKSVTVRGTILQNRDFMHVFYEEGYTDIEMEAGPYLSGIYEDIYPKRYPVNEIVNLFINAPYDIGLIHYASDTPISRRQKLLSKNLSYFGVDATYAASIAVLRRILSQEVERQRRQAEDEREKGGGLGCAHAGQRTLDL